MKKITKQNLFQKIFYWILIKLNFCDKETAILCIRHRNNYKLEKKYKKYLKNYEIKFQDREYSNIIWFCWLQGLENAPQLVKKCYESLKKYCNDKEIIIITEKNFENYVKLPDYIIEKWRKGNISNAHFADLLRLELLITRGGVWSDATAYYTAPIQKEIERLNLFLFSTSTTSLTIGNWFIIAKSHSPILTLTRDLLYEYWKDYNCAKDYFIFNMFFKMALNKYEEEFKEIPVFMQINNHILQRELFEHYSICRFKQIKNMSFVHKLSTKLDIKDNIEGTFYQKIINGEI